MKISELQARQGKVDLTADVTKKGEVKQFNKFGKAGKLCNATAKDESGEITLTLWNEQVDNVNVGDKIHITNGYVGEWQGEKQLSTGKFGQLEVVGKGEASESGETNEDKSSKPAKKKKAAEEKPEDDSAEEVEEEEFGD